MRVLLLLLLVPLSQAVVIDDATDDLETKWFDQDVELRETPQWDLARLEVTESSESFHFKLDVAGAAPEVDVLAGSEMAVRLSHGGQEYAMKFFEFDQAPGDNFAPPFVDLFRVFADGSEFVDGTTLDRDGTTTSWAFDRDLFMDEFGAPPQKGGLLTNIHATSSWDSSIQVLVVASPFRSHYDRLPDESGGSHEIQFGLEQKGAQLSSGEPFRVSNGEAGTFYYNVTFKAEKAGTFDFRVAQVPSQWEVRLPFTERSFGAGDSTSFWVEVNLPFNHAHDKQEGFILTAESADAKAPLLMGIYYVATPQPSGHHSRVWLHSAEPIFGSGDPLSALRSRDTPADGYFNALEDDAGDTGETVEPYSGGTISISNPDERYETSWWLPLSPGLRMGLNVTGEDVPFQITVDVPRELKAAQITGEIRVSFPIDSGRQPQQVATINSATQTLASGQPKLEGIITGIAGIVPYVKGAQMQILLTLSADEAPVGSTHISPYLVPVTTWFDLPLAEYSDSIADATGFVQAVPADAPETFAGSEDAPTKDSPAVFSMIMLALAALAVVARNRH